MLTGALLGGICGEEICGTFMSCPFGVIPLWLIPFAGGCGPLGSFIGLEVGGWAGGLVGATGGLMTGLCEGLCVACGGLDVVLGTVIGGLFRICGELTNVCNAIL